MINSKLIPFKLLAIAFGFLATTLALSWMLGRSLSTFTLSKEAFLSASQVLLFFFLTSSLLIIFALLTTQRKVLVLVALAASILFSLPYTSLSLFWKLLVILVSFVGFFLLCCQVQKIHEAYTGFSASHYKGVVQVFFLLFTFILGIVLFLSTSQALKQSAGGGFEIPEETLKPVVGQFVETVGKMLQQQIGREVPEAQLAPYVEEQFVQLLRQMGMELKLKGEPKSFAQVTTRITKALNTQLAEIISPFKIYVPFLIAGMVVLTLVTLSPLAALIGSAAFFLVYRFLILARILKFEEVERKVKRLTLN